MMTRNEIIMEALTDYLNSLSGQPRPDNIKAEAGLLDLINDRIAMANNQRLKCLQIKHLSSLPNEVIARLAIALHPFRLIELEGGVNLELGIYIEEGPKQGTYSTDRRDIKTVIENYNMSMTERDLDEVISKIERLLVPVRVTRDPDLIPVNNGVYDHKNKKLIGFSPDMVFLSKIKTDYNPFAQNPVIVNPADRWPWDLESWMSGLSDDPEIVDLLWQTIGAAVRNNVRWDKAVFLYAVNGNNGKGSLCRLIQNLCDGSYDSIQIKDFANDAFLERLYSCSAVICDENPVGMYIDEAAKFKAVVTGDPITVNRKYRSTLKFRFCGFILQCINELPRVRDRSESFLRRLLIIPMAKCFTGVERKYIKDDYLGRKEVLEYALFRVLNMDYDKLSEPDACRAMLEEYREYNDPVCRYWNEFRNQFVWKFLPYEFLYALYKEWFKKFCSSGKILDYEHFKQELRPLLKDDPEWEIPASSRKPGSYFNTPEPLIVDYGLTDWMDKGYRGNDLNKIAVPSNLKSSYRGLLRKKPRGGTDIDSN